MGDNVVSISPRCRLFQAYFTLNKVLTTRLKLSRLLYGQFKRTTSVSRCGDIGDDARFQQFTVALQTPVQTHIVQVIKVVTIGQSQGIVMQGKV